MIQLWNSLALALLLAAPAAAQAPEDSLEPFEPTMTFPADRFERWLIEVEPLITAQEKVFFKGLAHDYQRDAFIEEFWKVRDPFPRTARNELKERWPIRLAEAISRYGDLKDDRSRIYQVHGEPASKFLVKCTAKWIPVETWIYRGTEVLDVQILLIFVRPKRDAPAKLYSPVTTPNLDLEISRHGGCINGAQMVQVAALVRQEGSDYEDQLQRILAKPQPANTEWLYTFAAYSTDLDPELPKLPAKLEISFPGRYQQRTAVRGLISVPRTAPQVAAYNDHRSYEFRVIGEVLQDGKLFETFRYKFGMPASDDLVSVAPLPLAFERFLRPGDYRLIVKLEDLTSRHASRFDLEMKVPALDQEIATVVDSDPENERIFAEATAALKSGQTSLRLIAPPKNQLLTGFSRFDTLATGAITKVRFLLDNKLIVTKNQPPFSVEVDLGPFPDLRTLRAEALDALGQEVATDELLLNSGGYRFVVKLREPRAGKRYERSLQAHIDVEVPTGRQLDRVEIFLNEDRVATLYQPPFVQSLALPPGQKPGYVRAVAFLPDGNSTEDLVFINAPGELDEVKVQFVELYTSVVDRNERPLQGLGKEDFQILEDGRAQEISRFERVENLPIHVGVVIDSSASMLGTLDDVRNAALAFFDRAITAKDRAAVITFNNFPRLAVELTNDRSALGGALAGLAPEGRTALYDSLMFSLYYFASVKGQRAILLLSDGKDEASRFNFEQTLDYARRAGITIYTIGLRLDDSSVRGKLDRLATETGGSSYFIREIGELDQIYIAIEQELRSQLLLAYQSNNSADDGAFRRIEVKVDRPGAVVKTLAGYYP